MCSGVYVVCVVCAAVYVCVFVHDVRVDVVIYVLCICVWCLCVIVVHVTDVKCGCTVHIWVELGMRDTCGCGHTNRTPVCCGLSCVPLCVDACTGQRVWLTRMVAATPPHNQLAFFPPGDKLLQIDFPCQAQLLRTHPRLDSVKRKQTICSQGA